MSYLKQSSGAKIYISTLPYMQEFQMCHLEGESLFPGALKASRRPRPLTLWRRCRYAGAGGQGAVPDREQVQGPGPEQPVRAPSPPARAALAAHDVLGKMGLGGACSQSRAGPGCGFSPALPPPSCSSPAA